MRRGRTPRSVSSDRITHVPDARARSSSSIERRSPRDHVPSTKPRFVSKKKSTNTTNEQVTNTQPSTPQATAESPTSSILSPLSFESLTTLPSTPSSLPLSLTDSPWTDVFSEDLPQIVVSRSTSPSEDAEVSGNRTPTELDTYRSENKLSVSVMSETGKEGAAEGSKVEVSTTVTDVPPKIEVTAEGLVQKFQLLSITSMPGPKDRRAPKFKGKHVHAFVQHLEHLATEAGISNEELPGYVLRYCTREVRNVLVNEEAIQGSDWVACRSRLIDLYESQTTQFKTSVRKLRRFAKRQAKKKRVRNRRTLDEYRNKFVLLLGNLVKKNECAENEANVLFYQNLPNKLRSAILPILQGEAKLVGKTVSKRCPPSIEAVWVAAREYYSSDDINRMDSDDDDDGSDADSSSGDESDSDDSSSDSDSDDADLFRDRKKKSKGKKKSKRDSSGAEDSESDSDDSDRKKKRKSRGKKDSKRDKLATMEERIAKRMDDLAARLLSSDRQPTATALLPTHTTVYGNAPPVPSFSAAGSAMGWSGDKKCFVCGKVDGMGLDHRFGVRSCPETAKLANEGLLAYSPADGRMLRPDGRELPRLQTLPNGLATYLRAEAQLQSQPSASGWGGRDVPPHQSASGLRECMSLGLYRDGVPVFERGYGIDESDLSSFVGAYSMPAVTRSKGKEVDRLPRIEEVREDDERANRPSTSKPHSEPPRIGPVGHEGTTTTHRPHVSNTEEGWKAAQKDKYKTRVEDCADDRTSNRVDPASLRTSSKTTTVRFTSDVQDSVSVGAIEEQILNTKLTISLRDVLAMSPHLQKRLGSLVKTRREYEPRVVKSAEVCEMTCLEGTREDATSDASSLAHVTYDRSSENLNELIERYADAIVIKRSRLFAMASGLVEVVFGSRRATFLVDTGSELNLVSRRLWDASQLEVDKDGARWSLKGLGGENVPLIGCCRDAPLQMGGKNFDHHFFVCENDKSRYDGILGQPWFEWYAADIQYSRAGPVVLRAFTTGDKEGASASVPIVKPDHPRNSDRLVLTSQASTTMSFL